MTVRQEELAALTLFASRHTDAGMPRSHIRRALEACQRTKQQLKSLGWY